MEEGRISKDEGVALVSAGAFRERGDERQLAINKAVSMHRLALDVIAKQVPQLEERLQATVGVTDLMTRRFEPLTDHEIAAAT
jgi:hypothetical protein